VRGIRDVICALGCAVWFTAGAAAPQTPVVAQPKPANASSQPADTTPRQSSPATSAAGASTKQVPVPPSQPQLPVPADQVVAHTSKTIDWYRRVIALQQLPVNPDDVVSRDRLSQTALTAVRLAFDFGRAAAALASKTPQQSDAAGDDTPTGFGGDLDKAAARLAERVNTLQAQQTALDNQLAHASAKDRETLLAQRGEVGAALNLAKEIQGTVGQIERFEENSTAEGSGGANGLGGKIADLQRSVPEARHVNSVASRATTGSPGGGTAASDNGSGSGSAGSTASAPSVASSAPGPASGAAPSASGRAANTFRPESAGVIELVAEWFSLRGTRTQLMDATKQTDALLKEADVVRGVVTQDARDLARQDLASTSTDPAQIAQAQQQLEAAAIRFRQLSTLLVPVGEQGVTVESARNILVEWRNSLTSRGATVARYLALRIGMLLGSIAVVLALSEVWRRATFRYLHDMRRRQQFLALRRVAVGVALTLVIVFGLVSEVGSVATYAGLITAGLAVALQNVILAVVAYFFLIGRYGVRVGDRITLSGVTGRVVEVGLIRIYLMELIGPELRSSGRMVVLSNAVIFQPSALFKQMPGGDYFWHTVTMTLAAATDVQDAQTRLKHAADSVYENYRPAIEQQHAALQRFIDFETAMPQPEIYVRLTEKGLECTVRYPVEPARAASIDQKMLTALRAAQAQAPELQLVGGPLLNSAEL
jgi:small-conductance mechanosensitive channel